MCFSPQRRAIFQHLNFKKWSEHAVLCTFSLENVLLATAACNFSTSQRQKVLRTPQFFSMFKNVLLATAACNFWFLLWPHDSAPAALTSLLFDSPNTRIIWKTQHFATSLTFGADVSSFFWLSRYCIVFLLTLLSSDFTSSHLLFISAFQLSILSEVYYLNFLRWAMFTDSQSPCWLISIGEANQLTTYLQLRDFYRNLSGSGLDKHL